MAVSIQSFNSSTINYRPWSPPRSAAPATEPSETPTQARQLSADMLSALQSTRQQWFDQIASRTQGGALGRKGSDNLPVRSAPVSLRGSDQLPVRNPNIRATPDREDPLDPEVRRRKLEAIPPNDLDKGFAPDPPEDRGLRFDEGRIATPFEFDRKARFDYSYKGPGDWIDSPYEA